jgi:hypothetical protein
LLYQKWLYLLGLFDFVGMVYLYFINIYLYICFNLKWVFHRQYIAMYFIIFYIFVRLVFKPRASPLLAKCQSVQVFLPSKIGSTGGFYLWVSIHVYLWFFVFTSLFFQFLSQQFAQRSYFSEKFRKCLFFQFVRFSAYCLETLEVYKLFTCQSKKWKS